MPIHDSSLTFDFSSPDAMIEEVLVLTTGFSSSELPQPSSPLAAVTLAVTTGSVSESLQPSSFFVSELAMGSGIF